MKELELIKERRRKHSARSLGYYWKNREKINAARKTNPRYKEYARRYAAGNRERARNATKKWLDKKCSKDPKCMEIIRLKTRRRALERRYHPDLVPIMLELYKAKKQAKEIAREK